MGKIIITNVKSEEFEGFKFIRVDYDCEGYGFGTINIDNCGGSEKLEINECHMDYAEVNTDFKKICDFIKNLIEKDELVKA